MINILIKILSMMYIKNIVAKTDRSIGPVLKRERSFLAGINSGSVSLHSEVYILTKICPVPSLYGFAIQLKTALANRAQIIT